MFVISQYSLFPKPYNSQYVLSANIEPEIFIFGRISYDNSYHNLSVSSRHITSCRKVKC